MIGLTPESILTNTIQGIKDLLHGGLTHRNMREYRHAFVINAQDSLDAAFPLLVPFHIPLDTIKIRQVRVSFWILPFRAYSQAAAAGGSLAVTSGGGGAATPTSSAGGGTAVTSGPSSVSSSEATGTTIAALRGPTTQTCVNCPGGLVITGFWTQHVPTSDHVHGISHTHVVNIGNHNHTVTLSDHTHSVSAPNHTHPMQFGIYEENNHPQVSFAISQDNGITYSDNIGTYVNSTPAIEITSFVDTPGNKLLRFTSSHRARLSVQVDIKLDVSR